LGAPKRRRMTARMMRRCHPWRPANIAVSLHLSVAVYQEPTPFDPE
jgi:hypothetical protein